MRSKIYSSDILKSHLNRSGFIPILLGVGYLLAFPVAELLMIGNWAENGYTREQVRILSENLYRDGLVITGMLITVGAAFLIALWNFFYLYSRDKVDYYHSLPVSRAHMFLRKLITGLICYLVPYVIMLLLAFVAAGARGYFQPSMLSLAALMFLKHLIAWLFTYFCVTLVICMTGNVLMGILSLGGFCLYGPILALILAEMEDLFFRTAGIISSGWLQIILKLTPFTVIQSISGAQKAAGMRRNILMFGFFSTSSFSLAHGVLVTVLFGVLAYVAFLKRPSESTGKSMIFGWFEELVKFMLVIPAGIAVGAIFSSLQAKGNAAWWIFGLLLGTIMVKGLLEVLFELDFRAFFRKKGELLLCIGLVAAVVCIFWFDLFHFDTYIPAYRGIAGVRIESPGRYTSYYTTDEEGNVSEGYLGEALIRKDEKELGEQLYAVLEELAKTGGVGPADGHGHFVRIRYLLKSGMSVSRFYEVGPELLQKLYQAAYGEGNMKELQYSGLDLDERYLAFVNAYFPDGGSEQYSGNGSRNQDVQRELATELLRAYREDVKEATVAEMTEEFPLCELDFIFRNLPVKETVDRMVPNEKATMSADIQALVYPTYRRTLAILEKTGYPLSGEEVLEELQDDYDMTIYVRGYEPISGGSTYYGSYLVEEEQVRKEIAGQFILGDFDVPWLRTIDAHIWMIKKGVKDDVGGIKYVLPAKQVPAYVQDLMEKAENGELDYAPTDADIPEDGVYTEYAY